MGRDGGGWSGGQYSLARIALGLLLLWLSVTLRGSEGADSAQLLRRWPIAVAALASVALMVGLADRLAAALLLVVIAADAASLLGGNRAVLGPGAAIGGQGALLLAALLLCHLVQPPAPFLSWAARGRVDPGGDWRHSAATAPILVLALLLSGLIAFRNGSWAGADNAAQGIDGTTVASLALLLWFLLPPRWIPPAPDVLGPPRVFYDGHCALCHGAVRWILAEDSSPQPLRLAALQGSTFAELVDEQTAAALPDSLVLRRSDGELLLRSDGILAILCHLGGHWRLLGWCLLGLPRPLRDLAYDGVARVRGALFGTAGQLCPLLPVPLAQRFDP